jgi:hypothetical protein
MRRPIRVPKLVKAALKIGFINESQAKKYLDNYRYFRQQRPIIKSLHQGEWVASLNQKIYTADTDAHLHSRISKESDWERAYIRFIGSYI